MTFLKFFLQLNKFSGNECYEHRLKSCANERLKKKKKDKTNLSPLTAIKTETDNLCKSLVWYFEDKSMLTDKLFCYPMILRDADPYLLGFNEIKKKK